MPAEKRKRLINFEKPISLDAMLKRRGTAFYKKYRHPGPKFFLALNLLDLRLKKGWTQVETAKKAQMAFNTYVNMEQAQPTSNPTADKLITLAKLFEVTMSELWKERKLDF